MQQTITINVIDALDAPNTGLTGLVSELGRPGWTGALAITLVIATITAVYLRHKHTKPIRVVSGLLAVAIVTQAVLGAIAPFAAHATVTQANQPTVTIARYQGELSSTTSLSITLDNDLPYGFALNAGLTEVSHDTIGLAVSGLDLSQDSMTELHSDTNGLTTAAELTFPAEITITPETPAGTHTATIGYHVEYTIPPVPAIQSFASQTVTPYQSLTQTTTTMAPH